MGSFLRKSQKVKFRTFMKAVGLARSFEPLASLGVQVDPDPLASRFARGGRSNETPGPLASLEG